MIPSNQALEQHLSQLAQKPYLAHLDQDNSSDRCRHMHRGSFDRRRGSDRFVKTCLVLDPRIKSGAGYITGLHVVQTGGRVRCRIGSRIHITRYIIRITQHNLSTQVFRAYPDNSQPLNTFDFLVRILPAC